MGISSFDLKALRDRVNTLNGVDESLSPLMDVP